MSTALLLGSESEIDATRTFRRGPPRAGRYWTARTSTYAPGSSFAGSTDTAIAAGAADASGASVSIAQVSAESSCGFSGVTGGATGAAHLSVAAGSAAAAA